MKTINMSKDIQLEDLNRYIDLINRSKEATKVASTITTTFNKNGPLGLELCQRRNGGVMIRRLVEGGLAHQSNKLRKAMHLLEINKVNVSKYKLKDIVGIIKAAGRPLEMIWETSPSRSVSPYAREIIAKKHRAEDELRSFFEEIDVDQSGTISKKELLKSIRESDVLQNMAKTYPVLKPLLHMRKYAAVFEEIDSDDSNDVSFDELLDFIRNKSKQIQFENELKKKLKHRGVRRGKRKVELLPIEEAPINEERNKRLHGVKLKLLPVDSLDDK